MGRRTLPPPAAPDLDAAVTGLVGVPAARLEDRAAGDPGVQVLVQEVRARRPSSAVTSGGPVHAGGCGGGP